MGRRFLRYIDRYFGFLSQVEALSDGRVRPGIPMRAIYLTAFLMFACRYRSLNATDAACREKRRQWPKVIGKRLPSGDRVGDVMDEHVHADELRRMQELIIKKAWRKKALHQAQGFHYRVGSVDGHEQFATRHRCCPACCRRWRLVDDHVVLEYYHRVVVFQIVSTKPAVLVDLEPVQPGEGEVAAAERLLERVLGRYPRICQVIVGDAAYQQAPFFRQLRASGKFVVAVLKDERRELYKDVAGMLPNREPEEIVIEEKYYRGELIRRVVMRIWDFPELETWPQLGTKARVVCCDVVTTQRTRRGTQWVMTTSECRWWWATNLSKEQASALSIMLMGRQRWVEENTFNELVCHWAMDHRFKHAPNALVTFLLTLFIAHLLEHLFYARGLQPEARQGLTCLALAEQMRADLNSKDGDAPKVPP